MDCFYYYSKSRDVLPGRGANEHVEDMGKYESLSKIKDWRRILSNFHAGEPIFYEGLHWKTIEHAFQARKLKIVSYEKFFQLSIESGSEVGLADDGLAARKKRKWAILSGDALNEWFRISDIVMEEISSIKYKVDKNAREVLLATGNAQLWHIVPRSAPIRSEYLEKIRDKLRNE